MPLSVEYSSKKRVKVEIRGIVQGVGFRPFVYKEATLLSLSGFVLNSGEGVSLEVEGNSQNIESFLKKLQTQAPSLSRIDTFDSQEIAPRGDASFEIIETQKSDAKTMLSADISLCDACREEMHDPKNRRYKYPFINCTECGPRYTIIEKLPYDRENSSMHHFEMCDACRSEYENPLDRRYHAQPISCFECGPKLKISHLMESDIVEDRELIKSIAQEIASGARVAMKGLGGFHIICDARDSKAIAELRVSKNRPTKPFAVMFRDIKSIERVCFLSSHERDLLLSKERPVVLLKRKKSHKLSELLAPNIDTLGVFLPYTPLHELLLEEFKHPIVATSANLGDEPIIRGGRELFQKLPLVVEKALTHDREIVNACDDSVVMSLGESESIMLRLARGYGPKSFYSAKKSAKKILALGANQKNTITLLFENSIILSPHIGDLNSLGAFEYFLRTLETFKRFYNFEPDIIVCDKHPKYETTKWAKKYVAEHEEVELVEVQHHYAHALSAMAEYKLEERVLAFCFDGTGYGDDGLLWGGEVLVASPTGYERVVHLQEFALLGGEKAVREPRRVALSLLFESYTLDEVLAMELALIDSFASKEIETLYLMREKSINSPKSTSMGRLFDAVYALSGYVEALGYEGESGMILERLSLDHKSKKAYSYEIKEGVIEYKSILDAILKEKNKKLVASKFLNTVANIIFEIIEKYENMPILFTGGVFQNRALLQRVIALCKEHQREYYIQSQTPLNDGGISLGQAYYALHNQ